MRGQELRKLVLLFEVPKILTNKNMDIPLLLESRGKFVCCHFDKFCDLAVFNKAQFYFCFSKRK